MCLFEHQSANVPERVFEGFPFLVGELLLVHLLLLLDGNVVVAIDSVLDLLAFGTAGVEYLAVEQLAYGLREGFAGG